MRPYLRDFKTNILDEISQDDDIIGKAAVLIHRSRDHGIPGYTKFREYCGGEKVEDVDLIVLALAEKPVHGSLVGLTLGCVLASQYQKAIHGDQYWFSNDNGASSFSLEQLRAIRGGTKMSDIICQYLDSDEAAVQPNAFLTPDKFDNFPLSCLSHRLSTMSLDHWKQTPTELPPTTLYIEKLLREAERMVEEQKEGSVETKRSNMF
ncbi:hypothetical protein RB195_019363 [Necator americanus]|uniref:Animal hem peroxidase n=1 Tax=Necator americanus TaxID=51031 RepID=A0ABR1CFF7_NECAM